MTLAAVVAADLGSATSGFSRRRTQLRVDRAGLRAQRARAARRGDRADLCAGTSRGSALRRGTTTTGFAAAELRGTSGGRLSAGAAARSTSASSGAIARRVAETAQTLRRAAARWRTVAEVLGPAPYPIARVNDEWRYRIALRGRKPAAAAGARSRADPAASARRSRDALSDQRRSLGRDAARGIISCGWSGPSPLFAGAAALRCTAFARRDFLRAALFGWMMPLPAALS